MSFIHLSSFTKHRSGVFEMLRTIAIALIIALIVRTFFFEPFNIPSGSMIPSLLVGDYLFVSKFSYGYSHYTVGLGLFEFDGRLGQRTLERGDIAVFKLPSDGSTNYIKRIIGLPGDRIQMSNGLLHINGAPVQMERIHDSLISDSSGRSVRLMQFIETLPNGQSYRILKHGFNLSALDNTHIYEVPENHYFMMGDNRDNSRDSRTTAVGYVPVENFVGRAEMLFFSLNQNFSFWKIWDWPWSIRFERLFMMLS